MYNTLLNNINNANSRLKTLVDQSHHREAFRKTRRVSKKPLLKHRTSRRIAKSLHNALVHGKCWKCPCKDNRRIHLHIDTNIIVTGDRAEPQRFRLAFSSKSDHKASRLWYEVETEPIILKPPAQMSESLAHAKPKVRFALAASVQPVLETLPWPRVPCDKSSPISDICSTLCALETGGLWQESIGFITDEIDRSHRHNLYLVKNLHSLETQSLEDLLVYSSHHSRDFRLNRRDRLNLAAILACGVLEFHGSWLKAQWRTRDILFSKDEVKGKALLDHPYLSSPLLGNSSCTNNPTQTQPRLLRSESALIRNETLFPLGLALVELSLCRTIFDLRGPEDDDSVEAVASLKTASRHLQDVYVESGTAYGDVVTKCLFWTGPCDTELDDENFHGTVFDAVVSPLINDLEVFRGMPHIS